MKIEVVTLTDMKTNKQRVRVAVQTERATLALTTKEVEELFEGLEKAMFTAKRTESYAAGLGLLEEVGV